MIEPVVIYRAVCSDCGWTTDSADARPLTPYARLHESHHAESAEFAKDHSADQVYMPSRIGGPAAREAERHGYEFFRSCNDIFDTSGGWRGWMRDLDRGAG